MFGNNIFLLVLLGTPMIGFYLITILIRIILKTILNTKGRRVNRLVRYKSFKEYILDPVDNHKIPLQHAFLG